MSEMSEARARVARGERDEHARVAAHLHEEAEQVHVPVDRRVEPQNAVAEWSPQSGHFMPFRDFSF